MPKSKNYFKVKQVNGIFIIVRLDGTQWTTNEFKSESEAYKFLDKVTKHAKELMETHERLKGLEND